jgi:hypothetical protein
MKTKKDKKLKYKLMIAFGGFFAAVALFCSFYNLIPDAIASGITTAATCLFTIGIVRLYIRKEPVIDEMITKINQTAITGSWILTLIVVSLLFWVNIIFKNVLSTYQILSLILFFMLISHLVLRVYYLKFGFTEKI